MSNFYGVWLFDSLRVSEETFGIRYIGVDPEQRSWSYIGGTARYESLRRHPLSVHTGFDEELLGSAPL